MGWFAGVNRTESGPKEVILYCRREGLLRHERAPKRGLPGAARGKRCPANAPSNAAPNEVGHSIEVCQELRHWQARLVSPPKRATPTFSRFRFLGGLKAGNGKRCFWDAPICACPGESVTDSARREHLGSRLEKCKICERAKWHTPFAVTKKGLFPVKVLGDSQFGKFDYFGQRQLVIISLLDRNGAGSVRPSR